MTKKEKGYVFLCVALMIPFSFLLGGLVITNLWEWFVVPFNIPSIKFAHALGLSVLISFVTIKYAPMDDEKVFENALAGFIFRPLFTLLFGWVFHLFM